MKLKHILKKYSVKEIEEKIRLIYPEQDELIIGGSYEFMIMDLLKMIPKDNDMTIFLERFNDEVDVSGRKKDDVQKTSWALEFTPWEEWLGMEILDKCLENFTELEIIVYCLDEMSYNGFSQISIKEKLDGLKKIVYEIEGNLC